MDQINRPEPRLAPLPPDHTPELKDAFEATRKRMGFIPNSILIMQRRPAIASAYSQLASAMDYQVLINDPRPEVLAR